MCAGCPAVASRPALCLQGEEGAGCKRHRLLAPGATRCVGTQQAQQHWRAGVRLPCSRPAPLMSPPSTHTHTRKHTQVLENEFGGMNEVLYNLHGVTRNPDHSGGRAAGHWLGRWGHAGGRPGARGRASAVGFVPDSGLTLAPLCPAPCSLKQNPAECARWFDKPVFLDPLVRGDDPMPGLHANTHLAQVRGCAVCGARARRRRRRRVFAPRCHACDCSKPVTTSLVCSNPPRRRCKALRRGTSCWATLTVWPPPPTLSACCYRCAGVAPLPLRACVRQAGSPLHRCCPMPPCLYLVSHLACPSAPQHHTFSTGGSNWYEHWAAEDSLGDAVNNVRGSAGGSVG